jgi:putative membrane protein
MDQQDYGNWHGQAHGWGPSIMFGILCALIVVGIVVAVIWFLRRGTPPTQAVEREAPKGGDPAMGILRERFAKGEIDEDDYRRRAALLGADSEPTISS